ncbi:Protein TIC 214 [Mycena venus]|uniref:Protein TIC 214 n=1 Tax=Mycena venus TaxID=2733690 RepID=A0A8H7CZZ7_9AGAR|nr:Protein TIC 214 [Mycena venus]
MMQSAIHETTPSLSPAGGTGTVFALVIGINNYPSTKGYTPLQGCVNDARAFEKYLLDPRSEGGLGVSPSNILVLENETATRANIMSSFRSHLLENPEIPDHGETTMILFYAGHGTRIEAPGNLISDDGMVEGIAPVDERTLDAAGNYVHAIPDYILGWLLWELYEKKGSNITVIFDSCFSGGLGRDEGKARRGQSISRPVPLDLDDYLWTGKGGTATSHEMWSPSAISHVLLAACRKDELAREITFSDDGLTHGRFTESLINTLRRIPLRDTTYLELLNRLPTWAEQTPVCGGSNRDRLVFNGNYPATGGRSIRLYTLPDPKDPNGPHSFHVDMGSVEGVVPGTEFAVHVGQDNRFVCALVAQSVLIHETTLVTAKANEMPTIPDYARVVVTDWKNPDMILHVHLAPDFPYTADVFPTTNLTRRPHKFVQATSPMSAGISLRAEGSEIIIQALTSTIMQCRRETRFKLDAHTPRLPVVLDGIAHFNYFLDRHHGSAPLNVALEMYRLAGEYPGRYPDPSVGNLVQNKEALLPSDPTAKYGFIIKNLSSVDLFPYLFYFNPEKYTISEWYTPPGNAGHPLKRGGEVTVGMGGENAFTFKLPEGETSSSGFLKLFVSTKFLDLRWLRQTTPFDLQFDVTARLDGDRETFEELVTWHALTVIITMNANRDSPDTDAAE